MVGRPPRLTVTPITRTGTIERTLAERVRGGQLHRDTMNALLELPLPALHAADTPDEATVAAERALLTSVARTAEAAELRAQALVELMALEATCGDELAFERLRHELADTPLPAPIATIFRTRVAWGLARFGRLEAARRWARSAARGAEGTTLRDWLVEFDRLLPTDGR
jgi:hypothetical protein